jgi:hypothetical protein
MKRRTFYANAVLTAAVSSAFAQSPAKKGSTKKGWCGDPKGNPFGAHWYYTWSPKTRPNKQVEFVPMIKGAWSLKQAAAIKKMGGISHLFGFNEPEREKQGNVSVDKAIALWPQLEAIAKARNLRLGSPACSGAKGMAWFRSFMEKAEDRGLHMDFVNVHFYSLNADAFEKMVDDLADKYDRPVWVTEFNGWTGDESANYSFLKDSLKFLEKARHVERYAYYSFGPTQSQKLFGMDKHGKRVMNRMGELYRDAGT